MKKFEEIIEMLESIKVTVVSGIFLAASFVLSFLKINTVVDLAWVTVVLSGLPIVYSAIRKLIKNKGISKISSALLISTAMIAAIFIGDLFAAGEVAFIMAIGEILEHITTQKATKGLKKLISLMPEQARIIADGKESFVPVESVNTGDIVRVLPGETVAVDGVIVSGDTSIDQSVITGESLPVDKSVGDEVFCGTVNRFGCVDVCASKVGKDSSLSKLIKLVKDAQDKKAPIQRIADKWASILVPVALLLAVAAFLVTDDIVRAVTVLVVFCPCALVLATPTAIMAAIGQATKHGVIIKSGEALEKMGKCRVFAFDKTGTVTSGKLTVSEVFSCSEDISADNLLKIIASAECKSEHPLGKAVVAFAREKGVEFSEPESFYIKAGRGVYAKCGDDEIICGNDKFFADNGIEIPENAKTQLDKVRRDGKAAILVAANGKCIGVVSLSDELKEESRETVSELGKMGVSCVLLTGDNDRSGAYFAQKAGISQVYAGLLPDEKAKIVQSISQKEAVCMIGDGINDAPALKTADVGVAMGKIGSDIAVDAADIAIINDDVSTLPYLKKLALQTVKTIKFSIFLSLFINFAAIILSFFGILSPTTGALVHNLGACFVILLAARLYDRKI